MPPPLNEDLAGELSTIMSELEAMYGSGTHCFTEDECYDLEAFENIIDNSRDNEELLKAWNDLSIEDRKDWSLRIVGPWKKEQGGGGLEYFNKIKNEIGRKAAQVDYAGAIFDQKKLKAEYEQARIFAYPSLAEKGETFGLAVLEAMSCGCIPLVSSLACFEDFISPLDAYVFRIDEGRLKQELKKAIEGELSHEEKSGRAFEKSKEFELNTVALSYLKDFNRL